MTEKTRIFIPVSEVFPDTESDFDTFKSLLCSLSCTDTLFWCGRLNLIISDPETDHLTKQRVGLDQFFTPEEINRVNDFARKNGGAERIVVFFRGQLLELIRWVVLYSTDFPEDGTTFEHSEIRRNFAKAVLIASDIWSKRVFGNRLSLDEGQTIARKRALGPFRKSIEDSSQAPYLFESLGRGWSLFSKYFARHYESLNDEFQKATQLSIEEYYLCVTAIAINFTNPKMNSGLFNVFQLIESPVYGDMIKKYINLECQMVEELKTTLWANQTKDSDESVVLDFNYLPIREKPIFYAKDGRAIILDPVFYAEKMTVSPLFLLPREKRWEAFTSFGKAFEDYACDILTRMFPDLSEVKSKRLTCNITGKDQGGQEFEIDACLNDITEIVLFELKTGLIPEKDVLGDDYEQFIDDLREKYVETFDSKKGIGQLARLIQILASKKWLGEDLEFSKVKLVYPVMIVHDSLLSAPVYGQFFASEFLRLLKPDVTTQTGQCLTGELITALPILITISDLENLETSIEHFGFRDLLSDYSKSCPDRIESLHNFIASSRYKQYMRRNRNIPIASLELLEKSKKAFFPNANDIVD